MIASLVAVTLFNPEFRLIVNAKLASMVGLDEAIFLQQLHYWMSKYKHDPKHQHDGRVWIYNSASSWNQQFPFWPLDKISRLCRKLEDKKLIISNNSFNKHKYDKTKWYSLNYSAFIKLIEIKQTQIAGIIDIAKLQHGKCKRSYSKLENYSYDIAKILERYQRLPDISSSNTNTKQSSSCFKPTSVQNKPANKAACEDYNIPSEILSLLPDSKRNDLNLKMIASAVAKVGENAMLFNISKALEKSDPKNDPWALVFAMTKALLKGDDWYAFDRQKNSEKQADDKFREINLRKTAEKMEQEEAIKKRNRAIVIKEITKLSPQQREALRNEAIKQLDKVSKVSNDFSSSMILEMEIDIYSSILKLPI
jgi:hypothetical protein